MENVLPFRSGIPLNAAPAPQLPILLNKITGSDTKSDIVGRTVMPRRILVVDDNADGVASLSMLLTMVGHETSTAFDGLEAVAGLDDGDALRALQQRERIAHGPACFTGVLPADHDMLASQQARFPRYDQRRSSQLQNRSARIERPELAARCFRPTDDHEIGFPRIGMQHDRASGIAVLLDGPHRDTFALGAFTQARQQCEAFALVP